jgi:protein phosphatase
MYLIRDGTVRQLTADHSWVAEEVRAGRLTTEEARSSSSRNLITRALGLEHEVTTDGGSCLLVAGDALLLCSDGVHNLVTEDELVRACAEPAAQGSDDLVEAVRARGAPDNATVVIARVLGDGAGPTRAPITRPLPELTGSVAQPEPSAGAVSVDALLPGPTDGQLPPKLGHIARSSDPGTRRRSGFTYVVLALLLLALLALGGVVYFGLFGGGL